MNDLISHQASQLSWQGGFSVETLIIACERWEGVSAECREASGGRKGLLRSW